jgi:hypothetical protein
MIVDQTEQIAVRMELVYQYGSAHWQNLIDADDDTSSNFENKTKYLLFLWHDEDDKINEYGSCEGHNFTGELLIMVRSRISDESQETKYKAAVQYLKTVADELRDQYVDCEGFRVKQWKKIEVYDEFDTNMDGLKIRFTIETTLAV